MSRPATTRGARPALLDAAWAAGLAAAVLLPLFLGPGTWLVGDMVFVPHQPWKDAWLGLDGALPRAVPMDALVSLASYVVPGERLQRLLLLGGFVTGGVGVGRLVREHPWWARAAAISLLLWNPWVMERLLIGQWSILLGYLTLPWVALAARRLRADPRDGWPRAALALLAAAVCSPSSGLVAAAVLVVLGATRDRGNLLRLGGVALVANLTWLVPSVTATTAEVSADGVFDAFAARGESAVGVVPSLLSLGGLWKTSVVPAGREEVVVVLLSCALSLVALLGLRRATQAQSGEARRLLALGAGAFVVALLPALPGGAALLEAVGDQVPAVALLRDSHRFLAPLGLVLAVGVAGAAVAVRERVRPSREALWGVVGLLAVAPVLLLPGLAWGAAGDLQRSTYPDGWDEVAALVAERPGTTVVLPWAGSYRRFDWNHRAAVLDPAPRLLPGDVVVDDRVLVDDLVVPAEDPLVRTVDGALRGDDPAAALAAQGVRWVLVEGSLDDAAAVGPAAPEGTVRFDADGLVLIELDGAPDAEGPTAPSRDSDDPAWRTWIVWCGHAVSVGLLVTAVSMFTWDRGNARRASA